MSRVHVVCMTSHWWHCPWSCAWCLCLGSLQREVMLPLSMLSSLGGGHWAAVSSLFTQFRTCPNSIPFFPTATALVQAPSPSDHVAPGPKMPSSPPSTLGMTEKAFRCSQPPRFLPTCPHLCCSHTGVLAAPWTATHSCLGPRHVHFLGFGTSLLAPGSLRPGSSSPPPPPTPDLWALTLHLLCSAYHREAFCWVFVCDPRPHGRV